MLLCIGGAAGAAAQTQPADTLNNTTQTNETEMPINQSSSETEPIDDRTRITGWEYENGEFRLDIEAERQTHITISEAVQNRNSGMGQMSITRQPVPAGNSTISFPAATVNGEAMVVLTTSRSIDAGTGVFISTGSAEGSGIIGGPWSSTDAQMSALGGASAIAFSTLWIAWRRLTGQTQQGEWLR